MEMRVERRIYLCSISVAVVFINQSGPRKCPSRSGPSGTCRRPAGKAIQSDACTVLRVCAGRAMTVEEDRHPISLATGNRQGFDFNQCLVAIGFASFGLPVRQLPIARSFVQQTRNVEWPSVIARNRRRIQPPSTAFGWITENLAYSWSMTTGTQWTCCRVS